MDAELVKLLKIKEKFAEQAVLCLKSQKITRSRFREVLNFRYIEDALEFYRRHLDEGLGLENFQSELWLRRAMRKG